MGLFLLSTPSADLRSRFTRPCRSPEERFAVDSSYFCFRLAGRPTCERLSASYPDGLAFVVLSGGETMTLPNYLDMRLPAAGTDPVVSLPGDEPYGRVYREEDFMALFLRGFADF